MLSLLDETIAPPSAMGFHLYQRPYFCSESCPTALAVKTDTAQLGNLQNRSHAQKCQAAADQLQAHLWNLESTKAKLPMQN